MQTQQNEQQNNGAMKSKLNISFLFLSLGVLITLITSVVSFLNLVFETLDKRFPDVLNSVYQYGYSTSSYDAIRIALSTLIIFFPVFLLIAYFWKKSTLNVMSHIDVTIKKILIYIVLFISSVVVAIDLVVLVRYFVAGEVTSRFLLKVLATLIVALFVGVYYMFELNGRKKIFGFPVPLWAIIKSSVLVLFVISYSFYIMGSPNTQRLLRFDDRRIQDLQSIQYQIINYWQQKEKLPEKLSDLSNPIAGFYLPVDPDFEKGINYEYMVKDKLTFDLCATFALPIPKGWNEYSSGGVMPMMPIYEKGIDTAVSSYPYPGPSGVNDSWDHEAGRTCFTRTIDKDIYPPYPKPQVKYLD